MIDKSKVLFLFKFVILLIHNSWAQTSYQKDSLRAVFLKPKQDTNTVWALMDYGRIMSDESVDSANFYYDKSLGLSKKLKFKKAISGYYINKIYLEGYRKKNFKYALKLANDYQKFAKNEKNEYYLAKSYFSHAVVYQSNDQSDSAIYYYEKSLNTLKKINNLSEQAVIYLNISGLYLDQKLYDIGLEYAKKALLADIKVKDTLGMIADHVNLSIISYEKKDPKNEEMHTRESLRLSEKIKSPYRIMVACINMAELFKDKNNFDSSLFYSKKAYLLSLKYGSDFVRIENIIGISHAYMKKKDYANAYKYLNLATSDSASKNLSIERQLYLTELKINIYKNTGRYKEAAFLLEEYNKLTDSSIAISSQEKVLEFNNKLKKAESEKLLLEKEVKINKQKIWIYGMAISSIALMLLALLFYRYQNQKALAKNKTIKLLEQENEFVAVKSSLEGQLNERVRISKEIHDDLGSSLTTISLLTEVLKTKIDGIKVPEVAKISATSASMVDSMNEIVWALNVHNDTLESLVAFIRKYARDFLQDTPVKLVFEEDVNQDFTLQGNVRRSIYLVVKEAINNVVKHADAQQVNLNIQADNNKLTIMIEDDGKGINEEKKSAFGNGLRNMKQRIEDIGGTFAMYQTKGVVVSIEYSFS